MPVCPCLTYNYLHQPIANNRPFVRSCHMVQNKLDWGTNNAVALPEQWSSYQSLPTFLCFESPTALFASQHNLFCTMWPDGTKGLLIRPQLTNHNILLDLVHGIRTIRPLDNSPRTIRPRSSDNSPPIFRQLAPNMKTLVLRWANIFLCSLSSNFSKEEESLLFKVQHETKTRRDRL